MLEHLEVNILMILREFVLQPKIRNIIWHQSNSFTHAGLTTERKAPRKVFSCCQGFAIIVHEEDRKPS